MQLREQEDGLSIDDKFPVFSLDCTIEFAVGGNTWEHVHHVPGAGTAPDDGLSVEWEGAESCPLIFM